MVILNAMDHHWKGFSLGDTSLRHAKMWRMIFFKSTGSGMKINGALQKVSKQIFRGSRNCHQAIIDVTQEKGKAILKILNIEFYDVISMCLLCKENTSASMAPDGLTPAGHQVATICQTSV